ncbi:hypothetical protein HYFRA_00012535 [Hymenoscyphus fraxineus]|uniref:Uncharacterized protein n=1 Tax=Hymenoscyphus fraxineus TaxID=746836 RepID=A0A9N9L6W3_9HELO|nr:hypothetical protein HYFRA_00012535 [Hymenoscyphus fraxineus]
MRCDTIRHDTTRCDAPDIMSMLPRVLRKVGMVWYDGCQLVKIDKEGQDTDQIPCAYWVRYDDVNSSTYPAGREPLRSGRATYSVVT